MLTFLFRPSTPALAIRKLKDLRNRHFCALWQATDADLANLELKRQAREYANVVLPAAIGEIIKRANMLQEKANR